MSSLGEAARQALKNMDARKYEYQSDFARQYIAQGRAEGAAEGRAEGEAHGRAALVIRQLRSRFGPMDSQAEGRIQKATIAELDDIGDRLLTARTLEDVLGRG
jgi:flagellar biosynthesis/type III secretory pathway protein FliH